MSLPSSASDMRRCHIVRGPVGGAGPRMGRAGAGALGAVRPRARARRAAPGDRQRRRGPAAPAGPRRPGAGAHPTLRGGPPDARAGGAEGAARVAPGRRPVGGPRLPRVARLPGPGAWRTAACCSCSRTAPRRTTTASAARRTCSPPCTRGRHDRNGRRQRARRSRRHRDPRARRRRPRRLPAARPRRPAHRAGGGVPLFVQALVDTLLDDGQLCAGANACCLLARWVMTRDAGMMTTWHAPIDGLPRAKA